MKKRFPVLGIVLTALLALSISSCDENMRGQMDPVVDAVVDTPPSEAVSPPSEPVTPPVETVTPPAVDTVAPPSGAITVSITPAQVASPAVGSQLTISIDIAGAMNVAGYDITVGFDPTALRYVEIVNADYLPTGAFASPAIAAADSARLTAISLSGPAAAESGTLATATFEVVAAKASTLQLMNVILSDDAANSLSVTSQDGMVTAQ